MVSVVDVYHEHEQKCFSFHIFSMLGARTGKVSVCISKIWCEKPTKIGALKEVLGRFMSNVYMKIFLMVMTDISGHGGVVFSSNIPGKQNETKFLCAISGLFPTPSILFIRNLM